MKKGRFGSYIIGGYIWLATATVFFLFSSATGLTNNRDSLGLIDHHHPSVSSEGDTDSSDYESLWGDDSNATFSLEISSDLDQALFSVENTSHSIIITITPICSKQEDCSKPKSLTVDGVHLPPECRYMPCNKHQLVITTEVSHSATQYDLFMPTNQSMLFLRFLYNKESRIFRLVKKVLASKGLDNCNPTITVSLDRGYFTVCIYEQQMMGYRIDLDFDTIVFNPITSWMNAVFPISDVSTADDIDEAYILLVGGSTLFLLDKIYSTFYPIDFPECSGFIYSLQSLNSSNEDGTLPYLLYCNENYGIVDVEDFLNGVETYLYNETGHPIICKRQDVNVAELTVFNAHDGVSDYVLQYGSNNFTLPGGKISLKESVCFGIEDILYFMYEDLDLGTTILRMQDYDKPHLTLQLVCNAHECPFPQLLNNRYLLFQEKYSNGTVLLRLYDMLQGNYESETIQDHSLDILHLLELPSSTKHRLTTQIKVIISVCTVAGAVLFIFFTLLVCRYCYRKIRDRQRQNQQVRDDDEEARQPLRAGVQAEEPNAPSITVVNPTNGGAHDQLPPRSEPPSDTLSTASERMTSPVTSTPSNNTSYIVPGSILAPPSFNDSQLNT